MALFERGLDRRAGHAGDDRRQRRGDRHRRGPRAVQAGDDRDRPRRAADRGTAHTLDEALSGRRARSACRSSSAPRTSSAAGAPASPSTLEEFERIAADGLAASPISEILDRGVDRRLEGVRARGDARPRRQLRDHLLDRERRPDGRAHRRLDHRRPGADADRRRVPADARRRVRLHPPRRRRDRRLATCSSRSNPDDRRAGRHRDEPARVALVGAGLEGDRLPDRQDRRQARRRLHARRDPQRHHARRRRPASSRSSTTSSPRSRAGRSRSCPARRGILGTQMQSRRRGDGDRPHVPREPAEGAALARAGPPRPQLRPGRGAAAPRSTDDDLLAAVGDRRRPTGSSRSASCCAAA